MRIDRPTPEQLPQLRALWTEAFGEPDFWDTFLANVFSAEYCRCVSVSGTVAAALYWFECSLGDTKMAYLYAVATGAEHRHRGFCRRLMEHTREYLQSQGYDGLLLVPEDENLRSMYRNMGYTDCTSVSEFTCAAGETSVPIRALTRAEYGAARRRLLPVGGVIQEDCNLHHLETMASFWVGEDFLLAASVEHGHLLGRELLGNPSRATGIVKTLNCGSGFFRTPGAEKPFAMFYNLTKNGKIPEYFGLAFD